MRVRAGKHAETHKTSRVGIRYDHPVWMHLIIFLSHKIHETNWKDNLCQSDTGYDIEKTKPLNIGNCWHDSTIFSSDVEGIAASTCVGVGN